jgi:DNA polymerase III alpha subunit
MKNNGFQILLPDVNLSDMYFTYDKENKAFRVGLSYIKGIGESYARKLVDKAPYRSLLEFIAKSRPNSGQLKALAAVGALDSFGVSRSYLYDNAEEVSKGSIGFFGTSTSQWNEKQERLMVKKYLFSI